MKNKKVDIIILAGGKGTRLQSVVDNVPKPMAPIGDRPFLSILLKKFDPEWVNSIILSVGYKKEIIIDYFGKVYNNIPIQYAIETTPLGTGGAIVNSLSYSECPYAIVINGDTFFDVDYSAIIDKMNQVNPAVLLCLKPIKKADRYGTVQLNSASRITEFAEKKEFENGLINGGIYVINKDYFSNLLFPKCFSFENDFLAEKVRDIPFYGIVCSDMFIDIGIKEDFLRAQELLLEK